MPPPETQHGSTGDHALEFVAAVPPQRGAAFHVDSDDSFEFVGTPAFHAGAFDFASAGLPPALCFAVASNLPWHL
jgi:hypothetical protein